MTCANCGTQNDAGRKFCIECGTALAVACPTCGTPNPPAAKFCGECATPLSARPGGASAQASAGPSSRTGPSASGSERRLVSILFADLVGFTPFAEERDAEEVRETLSRYFEIARDVIERYGGTVEKFIGDAVMAVWGAPTAREDDAERAVRAGLDLVDAVRALGPGIQARAGVLTGEAAVTLGAQNQGLVAGDLVNTASRLQSVAPPGAVLVGDGTHRAASGAIAFEEVGEQALKGKTAPVPAWRAIRVVANRGGQGRSDLPEPPFVGRDEEFRVLKDLISASSRDPRVRVASITGPGGIGKSRLAWELEKYVDGLVESVYWHRGRSPSYGEGITFWALGEMVRQRAGLAESDDEATTRVRLAEAVAEYVPSPDDQRWVQPALLALLGVEGGPPGGREMLFAAWRIFFERIAARGTTVLLFEDLQWADTGLLDFIDHLVEWAKGVPILIVTLARPELFERRPTWGVGTRQFTALALEPLGPQAMRDLLNGFVPGLPDAAVAAILARADGIPLYAVETVRALVAEGRLRQAHGAYQPAGDLGVLTIPETLQSLIASRLDALDPADRALVQDAAVLGQTFTPAALAAVSGTTDADLERRLRALVRRELLEVRADPRSPERGQYAFVQSLIREVAYGTLARRDRRSRHLAVARYFEGLGDDELAGALATHYVAAYRSSSQGPEAEAVAIQARLALRAAAARAAALGAHEQAVTFLQQAVDVTTDPAERADLLQIAAESAAAAAKYELAVELAQRAVDQHASDAPPAARARAVGLLGRVDIEQGRIQEATAALESALALLPLEGEQAIWARILADLSRAMMRSGAPSKSIEYADLALAIAERLNLEEVLADAFNNKGGSLSYLGRSREAVALLEAAVHVAQAGGFVAEELRARTNLGAVVWDRNPVRALEIFRETIVLAERLGNKGMAYWSLGKVVIQQFYAALDWDMAVREADEVLATAPGGSDEAQIIAGRSLIMTARGEPDERDPARLRLLSQQLSDRNVSGMVAGVTADRAGLTGDFAAAYDHLLAAAEFTALPSVHFAQALHPAARLRDLGRMRAVLERFDREDDATTPVNTPIRQAGWAGVAALEGRRVDALEAWRTAMPQMRVLGYDFEFARCVLDALHIMGPDEPELRRAAEDARAIFERVGARPYLRWLDEALQPTRDGGRPDASSLSPTVGVAGEG